MFRLNLSGADIVHDRIAENIILHLARLYVLCVLFDDNGKLCLVIQLVCQVLCAGMIPSGSFVRFTRLEK